MLNNISQSLDHSYSLLRSNKFSKPIIRKFEYNIVKIDINIVM